MKFCVKGLCGHNIPITIQGEVEVRSQVQHSFEVVCPVDGVHSYGVNRNIMAEPNGGQSAAGIGIGGVIGLAGGPIGVLVAGGVGLLVGKALQQSEEERVARFNAS